MEKAESHHVNALIDMLNKSAELPDKEQAYCDAFTIAGLCLTVLGSLVSLGKLDPLVVDHMLNLAGEAARAEVESHA